MTAEGLATINTHKRLTETNASYALFEQNSLRSGGESNGTLQAEITIEDPGLSDKKLLRIDLTGYEPKTLANIPVDEKFLPVIKKILKSDPLQFIDYWSVDRNYKDGISHPEICFSKKNDRLETTYQMLGSDFGTIGIKAVDIFGNSAFLKVELPNDENK